MGFDLARLADAAKAAISNLFARSRVADQGGSFDVLRLADIAEAEVAKLASEYPDEQFYAFAIDDSLLCLNSLAKFEKTLAEYRQRRPEDYSDSEKSRELKQNTGDWTWQGFADLREVRGFDEHEAMEHYNLGLDGADDEALSTTPYAIAMKALLDELEKRKAFDVLKKTPDFSVTLTKHSY